MSQSGSAARRRGRPDPASYCAVAECELGAARSGLCWGHLKQLQRTGHIVGPLKETLSPLELVIVTGSRMLEAGEDDAEFFRALETFRSGCRAWMASLGWRPPASTGEAGNVGQGT